MKISARNKVKAKIEEIEGINVISLVKLRAKPFTITAVITREAAEELRLKEGDKVRVIFKATEVMISRE